MRSVGLDVHRDFCEVAIIDAVGARSRGRVPSTREALQLFAQSLARTDRVALEVTGNAWEIARILEAHVAGVVVVSPTDTGIRQARAKTDRLDALALARLLAAGSLDGVWMPDEPVRAMRRRLARRAQLVNARSRVKNEIRAVLMRRLKGRPPASDLFGRKGLAWLAEQQLPAEERETVDAGLRQIAFLDAEVAEVERVIALQAIGWPQIGRLELTAGAPKAQGTTAIWSTNLAMRDAERALAEQAEPAYKRTVADWTATRSAKAGASATRGHASKEPSKG